MAELNAGAAITSARKPDPNVCCEADTLGHCCEPRAKQDCCGQHSGSAPSSCGCTAGTP